MKFSLLISIYHKEKTEYFDRAMQSIWSDQSVKPSEIVLVQDGKLTNELYNVIEKWEDKIGNIFIRVLLKHNVGLGKALNAGLKKCSYGLVARMDTDDIALADRFKKQLKIFNRKDIDVCSSWVGEFVEDETKIVSYRKLPEYHTGLVSFSKKRNPLNHPAVMYKKSFVQKAGGYRDMPGFEDYYLWVRMIQKGAILYNIQEPLVNMRAGLDQLKRRTGMKYAINEIALQKEFLKLEYITIFEFIRNVAIRVISRTVPKYMLKKIYSRIRTL